MIRVCFEIIISKAKDQKTLAVLDCSCPAPRTVLMCVFLHKDTTTSSVVMFADLHLDLSLPFNSDVSFKNNTGYES